MKRDISSFMSKCLTCQQVKLEPQRKSPSFSRQKNYANPKRKDVLFSSGELVFMKVSPMKGVMRLGKKGKLDPRYIRPYEIQSRVGEVAYIWCYRQSCRGFI